MHEVNSSAHPAETQAVTARACASKAFSVLQDLQTLASDNPLPEGANHDVAANGSVPAYTLFPHADLQSTTGMQCSVPFGDATTAAAVQTCSRSKNGVCCVSYDLQPSSSAAVRHAVPKCVYVYVYITAVWSPCSNNPMPAQCLRCMLMLCTDAEAIHVLLRLTGLRDEGILGRYICRTAPCLNTWQASATISSSQLMQTSALTARGLFTKQSKRLLSLSLGLRLPLGCLTQATCAATPPPTPGCLLNSEVGFIAYTPVLPPYAHLSTVKHARHSQRGIYIACVLTDLAVRPASISGTANMAHIRDVFEEHQDFCVMEIAQQCSCMFPLCLCRLCRSSPSHQSFLKLFKSRPRLAYLPLLHAAMFQVCFETKYATLLTMMIVKAKHQITIAICPHFSRGLWFATTFASLFGDK